MFNRHESLAGIRRPLLTLSVLGCLLTGAAKADTLARWDFSGLPLGSEDHLQATSTDLPSDFNITTSWVDRGPNNSPDGPSTPHPGSIYAVGYSGFPPDAGGYFQFTLTPNAGAVYNVDSIAFDILQGPNGGVPNWWVYSNQGVFNNYLDYSNPVIIADIIAANAANTYPLTAVQTNAVGFVGITDADPLIFRVYGFGNESPSAGMVNFVINGEVTTHASGNGNGNGNVPEAFPTWTIGLLFAGLVAARSFQSRQVAQARA